jgi:diguanylate cyclase (GGDEF)-like protein
MQTKERFLYTQLIGAALVLAVILGTSVWMTFGAQQATDKAVERLSDFYLQEIAARRSQVVSSSLELQTEQMERAVDILTTEDLATQGSLRAYIGRAEKLYALELFALVDEDKVVYREHSTYMGGSRYEFLKQMPLRKRTISTSSVYGGKKSVCIAIPVRNRSFQGKRLMACFVEVNIDDITNSLAFDSGNNDTYFNLYYQNGTSLTSLNFGSLRSRDNLLSVMEQTLPQDRYQQMEEDFLQARAGGVSFRYGANDEILYYSPIPDTNWMMTVLIHSSLIHDQLSGISEETLTRSAIQIGASCGALLLFFALLIFQLRRSSRAQLEQERLNTQKVSREAQRSKAELGVIREIATRDALTGVGSKYAYKVRVSELNEKLERGELEHLAILACDLNGLKYVNDTYGHAAGDELICQAARMICEHYKHSPVYRTGGDEFVVLVLDKDYEQRKRLLDALNRCSEDNINTGKAVVAAGMAEMESGDKQVEDVFKRADQRMYEHKKYLKSLGARMRD